MSFCNKIDRKRGCTSYGNSHTPGKDGCSEARIPSCNCQSNVGCADRSGDCGGLRPAGTAATGACPGLCQCVEEEIWNSNAPPKPNCRWLSNFAELRRQWSDHGRQRACNCCCSRQPCRTVAPCRPCIPATPPCSGTILAASDCQRCCGSRRLAGGASKSEMAPADKSSPPERPLRREAGGGCPPPGCTYPSTRCNSPNADCSSTVSSCCPSQCRYPHASSRPAPFADCQSCVAPSARKSILKKRSCRRCDGNVGRCMCRPMPRGCGCPPPMQVDAREARGCSCECPSSPECACPPSERRFPRTTVKCPNARLCCPFPRSPAGPRCCCARCQPCPPPPPPPPPPCDPCARCRELAPPRNPCRPCSPCPSRPPCRPVSPALSCRPATPCRRPDFCDQRNGRLASPCTGTGQSRLAVGGISETDVRSGLSDVGQPAKHDTKVSDNSRDCCCPADRTEFENSPEQSDESFDPILHEESVENSTSKTFVNSPKAANPPELVDTDSPDAPEKKDVSAPENATGASEGYIAEKSLKDSRHTSSADIPRDNRAKSDRNTFRGEHSPVGKNVSGNPALTRLSYRAESPARIKRQDLSASNKLSPRQAVTFRDIPRTRVDPLADASINNPTTPIRNGRRRGGGGSSKEDEIDFNSSLRENRVIRWNVLKLPFSTMSDRSASFRSNKGITSSLLRKLRPPTSVSSRSD